MHKRVLINCSNLFIGGGVAVATSVIDCLSRMDHGELKISLLLSSCVQQNLREIGTDFGAFESSQTRDFQGIQAFWQGADKYFGNFDLVFTVFGPAYFACRNTRHLFGFAQPNILYPDNPVSKAQPTLSRWKTRLKFELQAWFFSRADAIVVELEHVKAGLMKRRLFQSKPVDIVYSAVHTIYLTPDKWTAVNIPRQPGRLKLGLISSNYPHKNLSILPEVKSLLSSIYGRDVDIYVTLTNDEWQACDACFRDSIVNVGTLSLKQCPTFYHAIDGVLFPSLLECFSAVPLEAMVMGRPLFASNFSFVRDVCGNHCQYFDPLDATDIARTIDAYFSSPAQDRQLLLDAAKVHVQRFPGPQERASSYLKLVRQTLA
jgi:glycosyltransferase involved in cell wall biosynthesis